MNGDGGVREGRGSEEVTDTHLYGYEYIYTYMLGAKYGFRA